MCVFHELPDRFGTTLRRPLLSFERAALIEEILHIKGRELFRGREGAFLAAVDQFIGELTSEGVTPDVFEEAVSRAAMEEPFQRARDRTLVEIYRAYRHELDRSDCRDGRDTLVDIAAAIEADPTAFAERLDGRRELRIVGLSDGRGGWARLLSVLQSSAAIDQIILYNTTPVDLPGLRLPRPDLQHSHGLGGTLPVEAIAASDEDDEMEGVAHQVRRLIEQGANPHRIAVIARDSRPYLDLALSALRRAGVPATARRRVGLLEIPIVRAVLAVLNGAAHGWTRRDLVEIGSQPCFASDVDVRVVNYLGYRERLVGLAAWRAAIERLVVEARAFEASADSNDDRRSRTLPAEWAERARDRFETFCAGVGPLGTSRPLREWLGWMHSWLEEDPWRIAARVSRVVDEEWGALRTDLRGWESLRTVMAEWKKATDRWPGSQAPLPAGRFLDRLRTMLAGDLAFYTEVRRGVQVQEALAASYRSFDHVFLVGMNAGAFPRHPPASLLHGEFDREALRDAGLPLATTVEWETQERALFDTLAASARESLTVSWVGRDELGGATNASSFVDLLSDNLSMTPVREGHRPVHATESLARHVERVARIERDRETGRLSPWNGEIVLPDVVAWLRDRYGSSRIWAPTQLEAYAKCPWSWFAERLLWLRGYDDPNEDMDPRVRGTVLHDALHRFYDQALVKIGGPVFLQDEDRSWAFPKLREALRSAVDEAGATLWLGHPALRDIKYAELARLLDRFLEFEITENEKSLDGRTTAGKTVRTAIEAHELSFEDVELTRGGATIRYRGIVDRIEVGIDDRAPGRWVAAVDYKTSKWATPGGGSRDAWDDGVVLQVPMYAHALTRLRPGAMVSRVEYRAIRHATRVHLLSLVKVSKKGLQPDEVSQARMDGALDAALGHAHEIGAGRFPARPARSCGCPPFCHAWDICRVAGGPRTQWDT
ncbi:MAG: PD-(D/E)XK nuclease family protein [Gemmatimonadales bacterium]